MKNLIAIFCILIAKISSAQSINSDLEAINGVLDSYHKAASQADWDTYFDFMSDDGVFLGTDASERWPKEVFREYAVDRTGWTYTPKDRNVNLTPDGNSAWFDEILDSENYGSSRGTGVLIKTSDGWKISQYHLTFPVPNELAREITDAIKAFEERGN